jgi:hypothetical protein
MENGEDPLSNESLPALLTMDTPQDDSALRLGGINRD